MDEILKQSETGAVSRHAPLGVELHGVQIGALRSLYGLDDAIGGTGCDAKSLTELFDCLVMGRIDQRLFAAEQPCHPAVGFHGDAVVQLIGLARLPVGK